ncbi:MAG TPA: NlpC/P60 family protein [Sedimentisphaerales bacterium]|nr:NlpC/P60 family protein [Sedimentisphaerales bacterium]
MRNLQRQLVRTVWEWKGVPFLHRGMTRRGCDCTGLLIGCLKEMLPTAHYQLRTYPHDWNLHAGSGDYIREELIKIASPYEGRIEPGDVLLFRFGRCIAHCAIVVAGKIFIHAHVRAGQVETGFLRTPQWGTRLAGTWRLDPEKVQVYL